jgi:hypothetical protein
LIPVRKKYKISDNLTGLHRIKVPFSSQCTRVRPRRSWPSSALRTKCRDRALRSLYFSDLDSDSRKPLTSKTILGMACHLSRNKKGQVSRRSPLSFPPGPLLFIRLMRDISRACAGCSSAGAVSPLRCGTWRAACYSGASCRTIRSSLQNPADAAHAGMGRQMHRDGTPVVEKGAAAHDSLDSRSQRLHNQTARLQPCPMKPNAQLPDAPALVTVCGSVAPARVRLLA